MSACRGGVSAQGMGGVCPQGAGGVCLLGGEGCLPKLRLRTVIRAPNYIRQLSSRIYMKEGRFMETCKSENGFEISLKSYPSTMLKIDLEIHRN